MTEKFLQAKRLIDKASNVLLIAHKRPDGDTLGSCLALNIAIKQMGKRPTLACIDDIPEKFNFMHDASKFIKEFDHHEYDLIIVSDAGASYMTKYHEIYPDIFKGDVPVINFDHHASNDNFGICNIVDEKSASTAVVLYKFFEHTNIHITPNMATALLTGIYNDTGSLMHSNTTLEVFEISGKLMELGGRVNLVAKKLFRNTSVSTLRLWGRVMEGIKVNKEGVTVSVVTWKDFEECGAAADEISGIVDIINSVPGAKYTCLLNEDKNGNVKGSFRTQREDVNVDEIAAQFGGGGHKKAAGFTIPGRIHEEVHWKIVPSQELKDGSLLPKSI